MATYTSLTRNQIISLLASYSIGEIIQSAPMAGGQANSSFIVTAKTGTYVLSICDEKDVAEISILTTLLNYLTENRFITSTLVKTNDGSSYVQLEDKPAFLKNFIDGQVKDSLTKEMAYQTGMALATLHELPVLDILPDRFSYGIEVFDEVSQTPGEFARWLALIKKYLSSCRDPDLPRGLIHGDLFSDNMVFQKGELAAILDFEEACNYYFVFDLGMCAAGCCRMQESFSLELARELIRGYQSKRRLTTLEKELLQQHVVYGAAATAFWRFRQFRFVQPDRSRQDVYKEMQNLADEVRHIPAELFKRSVFTL